MSDMNNYYLVLEVNCLPSFTFSTSLTPPALEPDWKKIPGNHHTTLRKRRQTHLSDAIQHGEMRGNASLPRQRQQDTVRQERSKGTLQPLTPRKTPKP